MDKATLKRFLAPIIEQFIDAFYGANEAERIKLEGEACDALGSFIKSYPSDRDWSDAINYINTYVDQVQEDHDVDISPIKQQIAALFQW